MNSMLKRGFILAIVGIDLPGRRRGRRPYVRDQGERLSSRRPAVSDHGRRAPFPADPPRILEGPAGQSQGHGAQHRGHVRVLGPSRTRARAMGFHRRKRYRRVHPGSPGGRPLGPAPPRALRLRRVGFRRPAPLASAHPRHQDPVRRRAVPRRLRIVCPQARRRGPGPPGPARRAGPHAPDRKRVRKLRQRPGISPGVEARLGEGRHRGSLLHRRRRRPRHARSRHHPRRRHRPRPRDERPALRRGGEARPRRSGFLQRDLPGLDHALGRGLGQGQDGGPHPAAHLAPRERQVVQPLSLSRRDELRVHRRGQLRRKVPADDHELRLRFAPQRDRGSPRPSTLPCAISWPNASRAERSSPSSPRLFR